MADLDQWVNLDPAESHKDADGVNVPAERCGPTVRLMARVTGRSRVGRRIFWGVQTGSDNVVPQDATTGPAGWTWQPHQGGFSAPGFYEKLVPTNRDGESHVEFDLSQAGGDTFTIKAFTKNPDGSVRTELESDTFTVWRQLFFEVTRMNTHTGGRTLSAIPDIGWGTVTNEFDDSRQPHNIRFTRVDAATELITRRRVLRPSDSAAVTAVGQEGYDRTYEPLVLKISLIDMFADKTTKDHTFTAAESRTDYVAQLSDVLFDENSNDDRDDWLAGFHAQRSDNGVTLNIQRENFTKASASSIRLNANFGRCVEADVRVRYHCFHNWKNGRSRWNGIWAIHTTVNWGPPIGLRTRSQTEKASTMIHEWGHSIGMVPSGTSHHYIRHGHNGNHCWFGKPDPSTLSGADVRFPRTPAAQCVMYGDSSREQNVFCEHCSPLVRSRRPSDAQWKLRAGNMIP